MVKAQAKRGAPLVLVALCCAPFFAPGTATAHTTTQAEAWFAVDEDAHVTARLDLQPKDIQELFDVDLADPRQADVLDAVLERHLPDVLRFTGDGVACPLRFDSSRPGPQQVRITATATCAPPLTTLRVDWGLSKRGPLDVVGLCTVTAPGDVRHVDILSRDKPTMDVRVDAPARGAALWRFVQLGFLHLITGTDHLVFLLLLLLGCATWRRAAFVATAFTLAHSVTLALAATDTVRVASSVVEPAIGASIAATALFLAWRTGRGRADRPGQPRGGPKRGAPVEALLAFGFGLVHGLGFAGFLRDSIAGLSGRDLWAPLIGFNLGLEAAQLAAAALTFPILVRVLRPAYGARVVQVVALGLTFLGVYWTLAR